MVHVASIFNNTITWKVKCFMPTWKVKCCMPSYCFWIQSTPIFWGVYFCPVSQITHSLCYGNSRHICSYHKINYTSCLYISYPFIIRCFLQNTHDFTQDRCYTHPVAVLILDKQHHCRAMHNLQETAWFYSWCNQLVVTRRDVNVSGEGCKWIVIEGVH